VTTRACERKRWPGGSGRPSTVTVADQLLPLSGSGSTPPTDSTPGSDATRSTACL
jgi:hypothetical protein